jgi:methionyl-tRNA formyltransferase
MLDGKIVKILSAKPLFESKIELPGKLYSYVGDLAVKTIDGSILVDQIQPEGKNPMSGKDFLNGLKTGNKLFI